jgi:glutamate N-acetyltransferase/amino-acid N-acetyltransferase
LYRLKFYGKVYVWENEIKVIVELKDGAAETIGWGSDLTYDYVKINAEYRS